MDNQKEDKKSNLSIIFHNIRDFILAVFLPLALIVFLIEPLSSFDVFLNLPRLALIIAPIALLIKYHYSKKTLFLIFSLIYFFVIIGISLTLFFINLISAEEASPIIVPLIFSLVIAILLYLNNKFIKKHSTETYESFAETCLSAAFIPIILPLISIYKSENHLEPSMLINILLLAALAVVIFAGFLAYSIKNQLSKIFIENFAISSILHAIFVFNLSIHLESPSLFLLFLIPFIFIPPAKITYQKYFLYNSKSKKAQLTTSQILLSLARVIFLLLFIGFAVSILTLFFVFTAMRSSHH